MAVGVFSNNAFSQYEVDFEGTGETKIGYASGSVTLSGISWNMTEALIGTDAADYKYGLRSARLRGYSTSVMTMLANKSDGAGTISFSYWRYGTDGQVTWRVDYSTNDGGSWTQAGSTFTAPANNNEQTFTATINASGNVRIRIIHDSGGNTSTNRRLNIDNITISDYSSCSVTITNINPASGPPGTEVTLTGTDFTGASPVTYNGVAVASFTVDSDMQIRATIPTDAAVGTIATFSVTQGCTGTSSATFEVTCPITITSISPLSGPVGTVVTIAGSGFTGVTDVDFNGVSASSFNVVDDNTITAIVPSAANNGVVTVTSAACDESSGDLFTVIDAGSCGGADDLFFSEYIEGSSNNKALEIYNGTGASVDLSNYTVYLYANGSATPTTTQVLSGTLVNGDVFVIAHSSANAAIIAVADITSGVAFYNGDDAIALYNTSTSSFVDIFGCIGEDPGTAWTSASNSTVDKTLVRNSSVSGGVTTNPVSGFPTLESEWTQYNQDVVTYLGSHTFSGGGSSFTIDTHPTAQTECQGDVATFNVVHTDGTGFQWKENDGTGWVDIVNGGAYSGATTSTLTITTSLSMDGYQYYCEVDDGSCTLSSNAALLTVNACCTSPTNNPTTLAFTNITPTSADVDWVAPVGGADGFVVRIRKTNATFPDIPDGTSLPSGSSAPWDDNDVVFTDSDKLGFTISSLDPDTEYFFKVVAYNLCGTTYKFNNTGLQASVTTLEQVELHPTAECAQGSISLTLPISSSNAQTRYRWRYYDGTSWSDVANGGSYSGATSNVLSINPLLQSMDGNMYLCEVYSTSHGCITSSSTYNLTVNPLPETPLIESVTYNCGNTDLTRGSPPSGVTWYWQGTTANGNSTANDNLTYNVLFGAEDTYYLRARSDEGCWSASSASQFVTIKEIPVASLVLTPACGMGTAEVSSTINGEQTFELLSDSGAPLVPAKAATSNSNGHTFIGIPSGDYTAKVTFDGCSSPLTAISTLTNPLIATEALSNDEVRCGAGTVTFTAIPGDNSDRIQWSLDGSTVVETDMNPGPYEYTVSLTDGQTIPVFVRSSNPGGCHSSWEQVNAISIETVTAPTFVGGLPTVRCPGQETDPFTATTDRGTIVYSIEVTSGVPDNPPTINSSSGKVTYYDDFSGTIRITATVTGCNATFTDTHDVTMVKHGTTGIIAL